MILRFELMVDRDLGIEKGAPVFQARAQSRRVRDDQHFLHGRDHSHPLLNLRNFCTGCDLHLRRGLYARGERRPWPGAGSVASILNRISLSVGSGKLNCVVDVRESMTSSAAMASGACIA